MCQKEACIQSRWRFTAVLGDLGGV